jgi:hypothetical protein
MVEGNQNVVVAKLVAKVLGGGDRVVAKMGHHTRAPTGVDRFSELTGREDEINRHVRARVLYWAS